ncbi:hypothetical protein HTZ84_19220 [Haloterrigena sp. SYSU A558-1]|uniref:Uncharacterized protein n=1 Tax=Haloterrigena gelatinilytica TaxID=2741724 RepID=A0A8J8GK26_9EURY|nr:hypothetical protein [Haloterrigena gelatinilytica]NUB89769.1 hypothetical protein [Haloterrigena gelatinilytica]NUC74399.1 hypothetical protein [Haloterrigena gelatinilytica]
MGSSSDTPIDAATDFEELAARLRTQSDNAPGSDTERVTIRSLEGVTADALSELLEAEESEGTAPGDLVFVLSRANAELLVEREFDIDDVDELEDALGRTVQVEDEMPDDTILLLDPDAVDAEEIRDPDAIACGIVGTDD